MFCGKLAGGLKAHITKRMEHGIWPYDNESTIEMKDVVMRRGINVNGLQGFTWVTYATAGIAIYGAILSTVTAIRGFINDRFKLIVRCYESSVRIQPEPIPALIIQVVNASRRPITVTDIGYGNIQHGTSGAPIWGSPSGDVNPKLPVYLKEQDTCQAWIRSYGNDEHDESHGLKYPYPGVWVLDGRGKKHYVDMTGRARWNRRRERKKFKKRWKKQTAGTKTQSLE
jgi:hypothetical protein